MCQVPLTRYGDRWCCHTYKCAKCRIDIMRHSTHSYVRRIDIYAALDTFIVLHDLLSQYLISPHHPSLYSHSESAQITSLFGRILSLLWGSFAKETYIFICANWEFATVAKRHTHLNVHRWNYMCTYTYYPHATIVNIHVNQNLCLCHIHLNVHHWDLRTPLKLAHTHMAGIVSMEVVLVYHTIETWWNLRIHILSTYTHHPHTPHPTPTRPP